MVLYICAYAHLFWKAYVNLISKTDLFMCFHIVFQISMQILFQILQDKKYRNILSARSELLPSIVYRLIFSLTDSKIGYVHVFAGSQVRSPQTGLLFTDYKYFFI